MHRRIIAIVVAFAVAGCAHKKPAPPPKPAPEATLQGALERLRPRYQAEHPNARLGVVIATRPQDRLVAVGDVPVKEMAIGQTVVLMNAREQVLTTGVIVRVLEDSVHAQYERPGADGREPRVGDVMVRF